MNYSDICVFTRSYKGDIEFIPYLYRSIEKFLNKSIEIVLVVPNADIKLFEEIIPNWVKIFGEENFTNDNIQHKYTKLNADFYTEKKYIFHIDSDSIFTTNLELDYLTLNGKPYLEYATYEHIARYEKIILENDDDAQVPPDNKAVVAARDATLNWLEILFNAIPEFQQMQEDPNLVVENRKPDNAYSLLMRPVGLIVLFNAISIAMDPQQGGLNDLSEAFRRMAKVDWAFDSGLWKQIMVSSKGTIANKQSDIDLASELAAWLITGRTSNKQFQAILSEKYKRQLNREDAQLPTPVFAS
jgi:hypothetical protein